MLGKLRQEKYHELFVFLFLGQMFNFFILIYVDVCLPACLYVYHMNAVSEEAKRG